MKKTLLFLGLLGATTSAHAQVNLGPWVQVNTPVSNAFAPGYLVRHVSTVSPTVAWAVAEENSATGTANFFFRTNNTAGTEFDFDAITASGSNTTYETANISAISANVAYAGKYGSAGGGEVLKTINGGASWTRVSNPATMFVTAAGGFLDFVHFWDANIGVAVGDPTNGYFEIWRTTDGGTTWTRLPQTSMPQVQNAQEYGLVRSYFVQGNTLWFGGASSVDTDPVRVFKSTNQGLTYTASPNTSLVGTISKLAFKDALNGIAYHVEASTTAVTGVSLIRTADGGATWLPITPVNNATGSFFRYDIDGVNGRYVSTGIRFPPTTPGVSADFGTSVSTDGINWNNISSGQGFFAIDLIPNGTTNAQGYAGAATDASGVGGLYRTSAAFPLATRDAALQNTLSVYPNPSADGVFNVNLGSTLKAGAQLTVVDALGRMVKTSTLNATQIGSKTFTLDLSTEKTGVYTLQIRTDAGIATQKLVLN